MGAVFKLCQLQYNVEYFALLKAHYVKYCRNKLVFDHDSFGGFSGLGPELKHDVD